MSAALSASEGMRGPPLAPRRLAQHLVLLRCLRRAAEAGLPCPTNVELADELGLEEETAVGPILRQMAERGLIRIEFVHRVRVVSAATGLWRTALRVGSAGAGNAGEPPSPPRPCARCEKSFQPSTRFIFRCHSCRESCAGVFA